MRPARAARVAPLVLAYCAALAHAAEQQESYASYVERSIGAPPPEALGAALHAAHAEPPIAYASVAPLVEANAAVIDGPFAQSSPGSLVPPSSDARLAVPLLLQLMRDWSADGAAERAQCYAPAVAALAEAVGRRGARHHTRVLVPGSGLGRLAYDLAAALPASEVVAIDPDAHALVLSAAMMTPANTSAADGDAPSGSCEAAGARQRIYPSVHVSTNWASTADRLRHVDVPDVTDDVLRAVHDRSNVSLVAGRFPHAVADDPSGDGTWRRFDGAATVFFLDVADDVPAAVAAIGDLLGPGGTWVNCGPLAYPPVGEALGGPPAYALSGAQLLALVRQRFELIEDRRVPCTYDALPRRLELTARECLFFVARARPQPA